MSGKHHKESAEPTPIELDDATITELVKAIQPGVSEDLHNQVYQAPYLADQLKAAGFQPEAMAQMAPRNPDGNERNHGLNPALSFVTSSVVGTALPLIVKGLAKVLIAVLRRQGWTIEPPATTVQPTA